MAKQEQDDLDELTKDELYELATKLEIKGRSQLSRQDLLEAVKGAQAERDALEAAAKQQNQAAEGAPPSADPDAPEQELSVEELRKITAGKTDQLELILEDDLEPYLRVAIEAELNARRSKARAEQEAQEAQSALVRWRVVRGGRYVTKDAYVTTLPVGSVITELTHDLEHVKRQGIELARIETLSTERDQLGNPITVMR